MGNIEERTGTAQKNQEEFANSLQGHLNDIEASTQSIWNSLFDTDDFKGVLKIFNDLLGVVGNITESLGTWGTLAAGLGIFAGAKNFGRPKMFGLKLSF